MIANPALQTTTSEKVKITKKRCRNGNNKRPQSLSPIYKRGQNVQPQAGAVRRSHSVSSDKTLKKSNINALNVSKPEVVPKQLVSAPDVEVAIPPNVLSKLTRTLATKKREFHKLRKQFIVQQNNFLENLAVLKDLESRAGQIDDEYLGEVRIISVSKWPAHDLLLLVRDELQMPTTYKEIKGVLGPQIIQQMFAQLNLIPEEVLALGAELMARRLTLLNTLRLRYRNERPPYQSSMEWKTKSAQLENETEQLHLMVAGKAEALKSKITYVMNLAKTPWLDRENLIKRLECSENVILTLNQKLEEANKKDNEHNKEENMNQNFGSYQTLADELEKERISRESLKKTVTAAENMLRVTRARITTLERQLKDTCGELEFARRKHRDLEQLYRHRESSYDARSKKLTEISKTGELTIEALYRQRDALELRVKELREQTDIADRSTETIKAEFQSQIDILETRLVEEEKARFLAETQVAELETRVHDVEESLSSMRERSMRLVEMQRQNCIDLVPTKECDPTSREAELWKELQVTRTALSQAEEELCQSRDDKDVFLNSLSRIAQVDNGDNIEDKMAAELLEREQKITKLQNVIDEDREKKKVMERNLTRYQNQMAEMRLEIKRLRNYDCYTKEISFQELHTEILELQMKVATLTRERSILLSAASSRALMLERHERAADFFVRITRVRRDLAALIEGRTEPPIIHQKSLTKITRSLSSLCSTAADTWSALHVERARVVRLERALLAQSLQLEREGRTRTQLERRRTLLEREVVRSSPFITCQTMTSSSIGSNVIQEILGQSKRLYCDRQ